MSTQNKWFAMSRKTDASGQQSAGAEISIDDNIGGWGITAKDFINELTALGDVDTINLRIQSGGGSIVEGNSIYNALKRHGAKIVTHIDSMAASMGSVIAMAGDEVHMAANGLFMIHNPWTGSVGDAEQLRADADLLDKMGNNIRNSYDRSNLSAEELTAAMDATTYYTAEEALAAGFIDTISDANLAAASIGDMETLKHFAEIPQAKIDGIKIECQAKQLETLNAKVLEVQGELNDANEGLTIATRELSDAKASIKLQASEHVESLAAAKKITAAAVSAQAAEQLQSTGTPPLDNEPEGNAGEPSALKMTEKDFWAEYNSKPVSEQNAWYTENSHLID